VTGGLGEGVELMESRELGKYTLLDHMGRGGVGSVYRASDNDDGSVVAVKVFASGEERPPEMSRRLRDREVRMLVSVQHPNIVQYRESGQVEDDYYYSMEFVGNSLLKRMRGGNEFSLTDKVLILRQTTSALTAIHHQGIVHRDIKPGNILLDEDPNGAIHVKLTDLGIAKNVSETDIVREQMPTRVPGTAKYLSPEQIRLEAVDGRADIFSLGVVAYELVAGVAPFKGDAVEDFLAANREKRQIPAHVANEDVPDFLGEMIERMLVKDREDRYDSDTLLRDLELAQQHLISGARMVERTDPASMFYEPPPVATERKPEPKRTISPLSWALALAFVFAGVWVSAKFWPESPAPAATDPPTKEISDLLREAESAAEAGRHWQGLALLRQMARDDIPSEVRRQHQELHSRVAQALAESIHASAMTMLAEGREEEAEVVLAYMKELAPGARSTRELAAAIPMRAGQRWEKALRETYTLVRDQRYEEALAARKKLLQEFSDDPAKVQAAGNAVGDLLEHWAGHLARTYPDARELEDFLQLVADHSSIAPGRPSAELVGELRLKLALAYRDRGAYDLALEQYDLAVDAGDAGVATRARQGRDELRNWLGARPHQADVLAGELSRRGFGSSLWGEQTGPGGSQRFQDGVLQLRAQGGSREVLVRRETTRPIRNLGFEAGVQFRLLAVPLGTQSSLRAGLAVASAKGRTLEMGFDGHSYVVTEKEGGSVAIGVVRKAFGDEQSVWHAIGLAYDFDAGLMAVVLDGEVLQRYPLDLSDFRLSVFLVAPPETDAGVDFKDVYCRP
jgi:serine/threonine protein kinase